MYCVYWMLRHDCGLVSNSQFEDDLGVALKLCEALRNESGVSFVTLVSENPNSVGKPGVDVTGPDYNWTKRRNT